MSTNFEKILSRADGNFEEQNNVLESSIIINSYFIVISKVYCDFYIAQLMYSINIIFKLKASSRNTIRKNMWQ